MPKPARNCPRPPISASLRYLKVSATSQQLVDEALRESQSAAAGVQIAIRERELAEAQLSEPRVNRSYATITAPISGVIALRHDPGGRNRRAPA